MSSSPLKYKISVAQADRQFLELSIGVNCMSVAALLAELWPKNNEILSTS
jgi:hypothetical protein